jgi:large subunit ribosomal protein L5
MTLIKIPSNSASRARLADVYKTDVVPGLVKEFTGTSPLWRFPVSTKIVLNMGVGEAVADKKVLDHAVRRHDS